MEQPKTFPTEPTENEITSVAEEIEVAEVAKATEDAPATESTEVQPAALLAPDGAPCRWQATYQLEQEEIYALLTQLDKAEVSPVRTAIVGAVAGLCAVFNVVAYGLGGWSDTTQLILGIISLVLMLMVLLYRPLSARRLARQEAAQQRTVSLWVGETGFGLGQTEETYTFFPYEKTLSLATPDLLVLVLTRQNVVGVPRRAVEPADWEQLIADLKPLPSRRDYQKAIKKGGPFHGR